MISKEKAGVALKQDHRWLQNQTNRRLAQLLIHLLVNTRIQPNHITIFSLILGVVSALIVLFGYPTSRVVAAICLFFSLVLDSADGQLARARRQTSGFGDWLDKITDRLKESLMIFAITYVVACENSSVWYLGMLTIFLVGFMYYNLELLKKIFALRETVFPRSNLLARNLLSFGYGERIIYVSIFLAVDRLFFLLCLLTIGCLFHITTNTCITVWRR